MSGLKLDKLVFKEFYGDKDRLRGIANEIRSVAAIHQKRFDKVNLQLHYYCRTYYNQFLKTLKMLVVKEIVKTTIDDNGREVHKRHMTINGYEDLNTAYDPFWYKPTSKEILNILLSHNYKDVGAHFKRLILLISIEEWKYPFEIIIYCDTKLFQFKELALFKVDFKMGQLENWDLPISLKSLFNEVEKFVEQLDDYSYKYEEYDRKYSERGFSLAYRPPMSDLPIYVGFDYFKDFLKKLSTSLNKKILQDQNQGALLRYYDFPESIRTSCNQYLMYFSQFLADFGIDADTEIKEDINETLFKVIPRDKNDSLEKIREALDIYLNIPTNPNFNEEASKNNDVAVSQLQANVLRLQADLMVAKGLFQLSQATIEAKDSTIGNLRLKNFELNRMLDTNSPKPKEDEEPLIKGVVSVKDIEVPGGVIKLPEILRKLKRKFRKKD